MVISFLFLLFCLLSSSNADPMQTVEDFELRMYHAQTRTQRRLVLGPTRASGDVRAEALANTEQVVERTNKQHEAGNKTYFMGWNELSDLSDEEYRAFLGSRPDKDSPRKKPMKKQRHKSRTKRGKAVSIGFTTVDDSDDSEDSSDDIVVPTELDWTTLDGGKYMTPIKNQGTCGSCWAFAGVSAVESRFAIENDVQASPLSVEQVLSCSAPLDHIRSKFSDNMTSSSQGCAGGMPFLTYAYLNLAKPHGLSCGSSYPYVMATDNNETECASLTTAGLAVAWTKNVSDYKVVDSSDEQALLRAVTRGPVTSNIDATGDGFRHYAGGIYDAQDCQADGEEVNHAVVVVGFGQDDSGEKFWIIRNTWGSMWGENGYMRIARGNSVSDNGPCNLYVYSSYPVNLTAASNSTSGEPTTVISLIAGVLLYHGWEFTQNRKESAGQLTFQDSYARWVLPTRDQIATALAQRRRPRQQQRTEGDRLQPHRQQHTGAGQ
ncbi:hypothetical protein BBP00_00007743 [Phytophthora kernoviae]|uniref:Peptidase C1A papain C-terminal domain-containing protein n=1 Tax=Phytophthora kernoviae TaxID=325452 RepID=A0A3F2RIW0_9STRA|nr:hypothetical protein BBP00_00007743 [Phytophthora kernoviae]